MTDLFDATPHEAPSTAAPAPPAPLADRMRPRALDEVLGQGHLLGTGKVLRSAIETGELHSMILWGPPGSGKTTLARLMAHTTGARFIAFSAVLAGVKEIREVVAEAERARARQRTISSRSRGARSATRSGASRASRPRSTTTRSASSRGSPTATRARRSTCSSWPCSSCRRRAGGAG